MARRYASWVSTLWIRGGRGERGAGGGEGGREGEGEGQKVRMASMDASFEVDKILLDTTHVAGLRFCMIWGRY